MTTPGLPPLFGFPWERDWEERRRQLEEGYLAQGAQRNNPNRTVGDCLQDNYEGLPTHSHGKYFLIVGIDPRDPTRWGAEKWYRIRSVQTGHLTFAPESYIRPKAYDDPRPPYSDVICPGKISLPPPPKLKRGDCVEWDYRKGEKVYTDRGMFQSVDENYTVEVLHTARIVFKGAPPVEGHSWHDIYDLRPCSR